MLEAAAAGLKQIRETEMIGEDGVEDLRVDIRTYGFRNFENYRLRVKVLCG